MTSQHRPTIQRRRLAGAANARQRRALLAAIVAILLHPAGREPSSAQPLVPMQILADGGEDHTDIDGTLYFAASTLEHGTELWKSDGTVAGTVMVKDIHEHNPDCCDSSYPGNFTSLGGGIVLFTAETGDASTSIPTYGEGEELWRTDGTEAGTWLVKDINPGPPSAFDTVPDPFFSWNGSVYFVANDGVHGRELWLSDGTEAGTRLVKDIFPVSGSSGPFWFTPFNGLLYFAADDGLGYELWRTDGTAAGTLKVIDLNASGSGATSLVAADGWLYFTGNDGVTGAELWRTDGTPENTELVIDLRDGISINPPATPLVELSGHIVFRAAYTRQDGVTCPPGLFVSDGTAAGTSLLPSPSSCPFANPSEVTAVDGQIFFVANDGVVAGQKLIRSDGTAAGTFPLTESGAGWLTAANGILYFASSDEEAGAELWRSDGTVGGTMRIADLEPGPTDFNPGNLTQSGDRLFFTKPFPEESLWVMDLPPSDDPLPPIVTPVIEGVLGENGWYVSDVTVSWNIDTQGHPLTNSTGCAAQTIDSDTTGLTITCSATTAGGTTSESVVIKRDATPPVATAGSSPALPPSGWYNTDVAVVWLGTDATSGIASCSTPETIVTEGENQNSSFGTCVDQAGLESAPVQLTGISIDKTAPPLPTVTPSSKNNEFGWYNTDVTATWTGTDALSGIASCAPPQTISTEGAGQMTVLGTCTDVAGNVSPGIQIVGINIDKTPPTAQVIEPRGVISRRSLVTVEYSCGDALSGVMSCTGDQPNGSLLDTTKRVKKGTFTVVAVDVAGNTATVTVLYEILPK